MPVNDEIARLLVLTDDPSRETELREPLSELAQGRELELKVVAPIRPASGLDLLTGDVDGSISEARQHAAATASEGASGDDATAAESEAGDADQLLAIADALAGFDADQIVLVDPDDEDLAEAARHRFELPVSVLDRDQAR